MESTFSIAERTAADDIPVESLTGQRRSSDVVGWGIAASSRDIRKGTII